MDVDAFSQELQALGVELRRQSPEADVAHLRKVAFVGRLCSVLGWATAWIAPNPVSAALLSTGRFARWSMIAHHVAHRGYDRVGGPQGKPFAEGWRRLIDWFDWIDPAAWKHEHNTLHHYRLNEDRDPDLVEANLEWMRTSGWPLWLKYIVVGLGAISWKFSYYAPNTLAELHRSGDKNDPVDRNARSWNPLTPVGRDLYLKSLLPYIALTFVLPAVLGWLISPWVGMSLLLNSLLGEILTNIHTYLVIVPNHAGGDLYRFKDPPQGKADFFLRQILGSANFRTGGQVNDFLHGYLNYQIEHHLWPDLPMMAYARAQPRVKELCARYGVPYVQESVFERARKTVRIYTGQDTMKQADSGLTWASEATPAMPAAQTA